MRGFFALVLAVIVGAIAGALLFVADNVIGFSLIILFPVFAGFLIGTIVRVVSGHRAETLSRVFASLIGGLVALVVYWGGAYVYYESTFIDYVRADIEGTTYDDSTFDVEGFLNTLRVTFGLPIEEDEEYPTDEMIGYLRESEVETYGTSGFPAMLTIYAETGVGISRTGSGSTPVNLTGAFAYGLWIIEALVLLAIAISTSLREDRSTPDPDAPPVFSPT